ncbi:hypothetical protein [Arthrobacter pigmenti]
MSKSVARITAALFIAAGAVSMTTPAVAANAASVDKAAVAEIQAYQPAAWDWQAYQPAAWDWSVR